MYPDNPASSLLNDTSYTQPALFALEYALARTWMSWGITPDAVIGHSLGEYPAACLAGVLSVEDGLRISVARGRLIDEVTETGGMATIYASEAHVAEILADFPGLSVAACNGSENTVISGRTDEVRAAALRFEAAAIDTKLMDGKYAFHSALIEPALPGFRDLLRGTELTHPQIPFYSTMTGALEDSAIAEADYWVSQARRSVRYTETMRAALDDGYSAFLEIGPKPILTALAMAEFESEDVYFGYSLHPREPNLSRMLDTLGRLHVRGADIDWREFNDSIGRAPRRVPLPSYPFQRKSYWSTRKTRPDPRSEVSASSRIHPLLGWRIHSPLAQSIYANSIEAQEFSFVRDHILHDRNTMPATAMVETVCAAAEDRLGAKSEFTILELGIQTPMLFEQTGPRSIQTVTNPRDDGSFGVSLFSRVGEDWINHAAADVMPGRVDRPATALMDLQQRCDQPGSVTQYYEHLRESGAAFGADMQGVRQLWFSDSGETLGVVELDAASSESGYLMHPGVLDGCLQVGASGYRHFTSAGDTGYLPYLWEGVHVFAPFPNRVWCHAKLEEVVSDEIRTVALTVYAEDGTQLGSVDALHFKKARREAFLKSGSGNSLPLSWLAERNWEPVDLDALPTGRKWWVVACDESTAELASEALDNAGQSCSTTVLDSPVGRQRMAELLRDQLGPDRPPLNGILYIPTGRGLSDPSRQERITGNALSLLQAVEGLNELAGGPAHEDIRLVFVSLGAQATGFETAPIDLAGSTLWGLAKSARRESADLDLVSVDLPLGDSDDLRRALVDCLRAPRVETRVAWRSGQLLAERVAPHAAGSRGPSDSFRLRRMEPGVLKSLQWQPVNRPIPDADEVVIEVEAAALNFRDVLFVLDRLEGALGYDCSGIVVECGPNVTHFKPGDAVLTLGDGTFASHVAVPAGQIAHRPTGMTAETAASLPIVFLTARHALENLAELKSGEWLLLHSAAGGVGLAAIQFAKQVGARVIATAHPSKWGLLRALGVEHIANSRTLDFPKLVMAVTGGSGVDVVLNTLANEFVPKSLEVLRHGGRFVELGRLNVWTEEEVAQTRPDVSFHHFLMGTVAKEEPGLAARLLQETVDAIEDGLIRPTPVRVFPADRVVEAFEVMSQARHVGKLVVSLRDFPQNPGSPEIRKEDAAYLITGGLGGLGLQLAEWLVDQGASHLVLIGRTPPNNAAKETITGLRSRGAVVQTHAVDVTNRAGMESLLGRLQTDAPRLRGIFHLAGVLEDGVVIHQN